MKRSVRCLATTDDSTELVGGDGIDVSCGVEKRTLSSIFFYLLVTGHKRTQAFGSSHPADAVESKNSLPLYIVRCAGM